MYKSAEANLWQVSDDAEQRKVCACLPETYRGPHHLVCRPPKWKHTKVFIYSILSFNIPSLHGHVFPVVSFRGCVIVSHHISGDGPQIRLK